MIALTFDALKFVSSLENAGIPRAQATAEAEALREAFHERDQAIEALERQLGVQQAQARHDAEKVATKGDIREVKAEMADIKTEVKLLEQRTQSRFVLLQWMLATLLAGMFAVLGGVLSLLVKVYS